MFFNQWKIKSINFETSNVLGNQHLTISQNSIEIEKKLNIIFFKLFRHVYVCTVVSAAPPAVVVVDVAVDVVASVVVS